MTMTFGESFTDAIRGYLAKNSLKSLGQISSRIFTELADEFFQKWTAHHKATKDRAKAKRAAFMPPTPSEVEEYSDSVGYPLDGEGWCAHYECKGWKISGSTGMTSWQAAIRKWKSKGWKLEGPNGAASTGQQNASLGALQMQLKRTEEELSELLYPGGAAYKTTPTGDKLVRANALSEQRKALKARMEGAR
jgi:hypothetical protein